MRISLRGFTLLMILSYLATVLVGSYYQYTRYKELQLESLSVASKGAILKIDHYVSGELGLHDSKPEQLLAHFDRALATSPFLESISYSPDATKIAVSTDRKLTGEPFPSNAASLLAYNFSKQEVDGRYFFHKISFLKNAEFCYGYLIAKINYEDMSKKLRSNTYDIIVKMLYVHFLLYIALYLIANRYFLSPLRQITQNAKDGSIFSAHYLVTEFENLEKTLNNSFSTLYQKNSELQAALEKERRLEKIIETVTDINQLLISEKDIPVFLQKSCDRLGLHGDYEMVCIGFMRDDRLTLKYKGGKGAQIVNDSFFDFDLSGNSGESQLLPSVRALKSGETVILDKLLKDDAYAFISNSAGLTNIKSLISLPLKKDIYSEPFGVISVYSSSEFGFDDKEAAMLEELDGDIGFGVNAFMQKQELENQAYIHRLSRIKNRFRLLRDLQDLSVACVGVLNIDRFKEINELYGMPIGDRLLIMFAKEIGDGVERDGFLFYHINADEFAILDSSGNLEQLKNEIEKIIELVDDKTFEIDGIDIDISVSAGISSSVEKAMEEAEAALKRAKNKKMKYLYYGDIGGLLDEQKESNIGWYKKIKNALREDKILTFYQPIVDNKTQKIVKYECLVRLKDEKGVIHSPFFFLDIAKKTRLYPQITKAVVKNAISELKDKHIDFSINLSIDDMLNPETTSYIKTLVVDNKVCKNIIFEILESEGIESFNEVIAFIEEMKECGCRFAIDDFGTGYSNFEYLLRLNVDYLKIDGSLIKNMTYDENAKTIVEGIHNFAKSINIETVAEFVSSEDIYKEVAHIGVDFSQGYYFGVPSPKLVEA